MTDTETYSICNMEPDAAPDVRIDAEAEAAHAAGRYVQHARVSEWLMKLAKGEITPPPRS